MTLLHSPVASGRLPTGESDAASERENPLNLLLDAFEGQVQALIDNGLGAQLRARLARLLPVPSPAAASPAGESQATTKTITALEWGAVLTALRATKPRDGAEAQAIRAARAWVIAQMQAAQQRETQP